MNTRIILKKLWRKFKRVVWGRRNLVLPEELVEQLDNRTIDLGLFLGKKNQVIELKELTFMIGGSQVLDYAFLKKIADIFECKKYLEIGTYIGESINILTDSCDVLYSITAPLDASFSMAVWTKNLNMPDYSNRLVYSTKIKQFFANSEEFDYTVLPKDIDLFFIDANHEYEAVYSDTKNIFNIKHNKAIVVWHDFRLSDRTYNASVVKAVADAIGEEFRNVYVTNNNICGIYLPDEFKNEFVLRKLQYEVGIPLYTFDTQLKVSVKEGK